MLRSLTVAAVLSFGLCAVAAAQEETPRGFCGTPEVDLSRLRANIAAAAAVPTSLARQQAVTSIPVRFKIIGRDDSIGAASINNILDLMTSINRDFEPYNLQFYLESAGGTSALDFYYNTKLYDDHANNLSLLTRFRAANAITIYVPNDATPPNSNGLGVTLGYYSPSEDYLVFARKEVSSNSSTASHELGHYFGLPHTFRGWDCSSWDNPDDWPTDNPVEIDVAPCSSVPVELVTRDTGANCSTAGDLFCDTPADYNLGFGYSSCDYTGPVKDRNGDALDPDESNFMGYFLGCDPYTFSPMQVQAMIADYRSANRRFLRSGQGPRGTTAELGRVVVKSPGLLPTEFGDQATITWDAVPGAEFYSLEVSERRSFSPYTANVIVAGETSYTLTGLTPTETYYYRIRPFSDLSFGVGGSTQLFTTGTTVGLEREPDAFTQLQMSPNPVAQGQSLDVSFFAAGREGVEMTVRDLTGRVLTQRRLEVSPGGNRVLLDESGTLVPGSYVLSLSSASGLSSRKFLVR